MSNILRLTFCLMIECDAMHIGQKKIGQVEYHPKDCLSYFRLGDLFYDWEFCILCSSSLKGETCKGVTTHTECKENSGELFKGKFDFFFYGAGRSNWPNLHTKAKKVPTIIVTSCMIDYCV